MTYLSLKSRVYSAQPKYTHLSPVNENIRYGQYKLWSEEQSLDDVVLVLEELQWSTMSPNLL